MTDKTWTLSLRESGQSSDTDLTVNSLRGPIVEATPTNEDTAILDFSTELPNETAKATRYNTARQLLAYPNSGDRGLDEDRLAWFEETIPSEAPVDSQVVQLVPSSDLQAKSFRGVWAVVTGGRDRTRFGSNLVLELDLFVLAESSDYADRAAMETALGVV